MNNPHTIDITPVLDVYAAGLTCGFYQQAGITYYRDPNGCAYCLTGFEAVATKGEPIKERTKAEGIVALKHAGLSVAEISKLRKEGLL